MDDPFKVIEKAGLRFLNVEAARQAQGVTKHQSVQLLKG